MSISETRYVDITSGVGGASVLTQRALVARIFTSNVLIPPQSHVSFSSADSVGSYFGTSSEEYLRALFYFSFISKIITSPQTIQFARWTPEATAPRIQSLSGNGSLISNWSGIDNGSFGLTINGVVGVFSGLDFTGAADLAAVALIVQTAIRSSFSVAQTGSLTAASTTVTMADTTGVVVGMNVTGTGIPASTTVVSIIPNTSIVISNAAVGITQTGTLTSADPEVTGLVDTSILVTGMKVTGTGIAGATTILTIDDATTITLSANATATGAEALTFIAATTALTFYTNANALYANTSVTYSAGGFTLVAGIEGAGVPNTLSVQNGLTGTDLTAQPLLGWLPAAIYDALGNHSAGAIVSIGSDAETVTELLAMSSNLSNNFGSFLFLNNLNLSLPNAILAAAWNITQNNTYMFCAGVYSESMATQWAADVGGLGTYAGTALTLSGASFSLTGTVAQGSNIISGIGNVSDLTPGMPISGANIAAGTIVTAVTTFPAQTVIMSNVATGSNTEAITFTFNQFPEQIPMMVLAATDYSLVNSAQNYMFQGPFAGLFPLVTTDNDADFYDALSVNYYGSTQQSGQIINFYQRGVLLGTATSPLDMTTYTNEMWLKDAITVEILNLFVGVSQVPANEQGRSLLLTSIQDPINDALANGTISVNKTLTTIQKQFISSVTNDPEAWYQVQNIGYWVDCQIVPSSGSPVIYTAAFTLVYSKDDVIRFVSGRDILI